MLGGRLQLADRFSDVPGISFWRTSLRGRRSRQTAGFPKAPTRWASRSGERAYGVGAVARLRAKLWAGVRCFMADKMR